MSQKKNRKNKKRNSGSNVRITSSKSSRRKESGKRGKARDGKGLSGVGRMIILFLCFFASMSFWELFLSRQIHGSLSGLSPWVFAFLPAEAMLFTFLTGWLSNRIAERICSTLVMAVVWFFYVAQLVYFRIFGSMFSISMVGMAGDAVGNFGWALRSTIKDSILVILITTIPLILFAAGQFLFRSKLKYSFPIHLAALILVPALWLAAVYALPLGGTQEYSVYAAYHSSLIDTDTSSSKLGILANSAIETASMLLGTKQAPQEEEEELDDLVITEEPEIVIDRSPNIIEEIDFAALAEKTSDSTIKELCQYFQTVQGTSKNEYTGMFEGYNLIYICAESFSNLALDENVMPVLYKMANEGIVLNNYYNSFKNTTTNGEYAFLTSMWPDVSRNAKFGSSVGSFPKSASHYMPFGLGTLFNEQCGTVARAYHNYRGSYYARDKTLPNLGFTCKFMGSGMSFTSAWPSSDLEMMQQSVDDYINDEQFCAYYMTFSGHGPYTSENVMYNRNISTVRSLLGDRNLTYIGRGYLACNYELEKAMAYLVQRLEEAGKLENTVIVLTGDHYPYYVYENDRNSLAGHVVDTDFEMYKSTCIMWAPGLEETIQVDTPCCNVDILPTILNLFGIEYDSRLLAGRDIFSNTPHYAALYNKSFITSDVMYNSATGKATWLTESDETEQYKTNYLNYYINQVKNRYSMSLKIEDTDFYRFVWGNTEFAPDEPEVQNPDGTKVLPDSGPDLYGQDDEPSETAE